MKTKNFNFEMFKKGVPAQTKLGNPARFISVSVRGELLIAIKSRLGIEETYKYQFDGRRYKGANTMYDLEMVNAYEVGLPRDAKGRFIKRS